MSSEARVSPDALALSGKLALRRPIDGRSRSLPWKAAAVWVFGVAFFIAYRFGMSFSHAVPAPLWFPDAVLLCALLLTPPRLWPLFILTTAPIRFWLVPASEPPWFLVAAFANDTLKALLSATLLRRALWRPTRFDSLRDFGVFVGVAVLGVPILSAAAGAAAFVQLGRPFWPSWQRWFLGDALAALLLVPAILYWLFPGHERRKSDRSGRISEATLLGLGLVSIGLAAFSGRVPSPYDTLILLYAPVPFLLWATLRFRLRGATAVLTVSALLAAAAAAQGRGPFGALPPDERILWIQLFLFVVALPVLFLAAVLWERDESVAKLRASEERYRGVVNSQTDLICRYLPDTTLTFVNEAYCRYFGRSREELIGHRFLELMPESAREAAYLHVASLLRHPRVEMDEHEVLLPDGSIGWQQWVDYAVLGRDGRVAEFQGIGRDITDRKHAEEADRKIAQTARLSLLGELTASIAHEINQPLGAITSNADALEMLLESGHANPDEIRTILADIRREGLRASEVIRQVRSLVRRRATEMGLLDVNEVATEVLRLTTPECRRRGVALETQLAPALPAVRGDRVGLQQVLLNLMMNGMDAMKDTPVGERRLVLRTLPEGNGKIEVAVIDAGHGIAPELLPRLFDSFVTTRETGMGLGLSISRTIVESHGGRIAAENKPGGGAIVRFELPSA